MEKNLGHATAYGYAKSKGYSGTEDEFAELMADYASVGQSAAQSAEQAAASATSASGSAATASQAAQTATSKASEAVTAAGTATTKASEASQSASTASAAATSAGTSAQTATTAASTATTKASEASESATTASTAKTDAETARDAAARSASEAAASAESIDPDEFNRKIYAAFATDIASGSIASFADGADSIPMKDVLVHIEPVQEGSGDPSPDNVRPITGWTGVEVTRCGKNLFDVSKYQNINTEYDFIDSEYHCKYIQLKSNSTYTISFNAGTETNSPVLLINNDPHINKAGYFDLRKASDSKVFQTDDSGRLYIGGLSGSNASYNARLALCNTQIELGSTATDYEPYSGQTYDITFPTEAGTVYGGTLDVTKGELVVERAMMMFDGTQAVGSANWQPKESTRAWLYALKITPYIKKVSIPSDYPNIISDKLKTVWYEGPEGIYGGDFACISVVTQGNTSWGIAMRVADTSLTTASAINAWLASNPVTVVYELTTPITYQLTPQEITSLLGTNNLWADTGNSNVEYRADTKMYIARQIADAVSALS